jgi:phosphohistidine swiveling domain-containing protein
MTWIRTADNLAPNERNLVGGKAYQLAQLQRQGFKTAPWLCVTTSAYDAYLNATGLRERIAMELHRKAFEEMRWEELWDCATRIRHMFLAVPIPEPLRIQLESAIHTIVGSAAVAVRSSAIDEDTQAASFAGLHDSYVNIRGIDAIIRHIRLVWASLWSDAALLYRQEIGLEVTRSAMAVVVQSLVVGSCSGVAFTVHPTNQQQAVIEAVYGLNQGLVDGTISPDRWVIQRDPREIISHRPVRRQFYMVPDQRDIRKAALPENLAGRPPLTPNQVFEVYTAAMAVESAFGTPQDVEWTLDSEALHILQARPITTRPESGSDQRGWYLSLHKSFEQLIALRQLIENQHIPRMINAAEAFLRVDLDRLSTEALTAEIKHRWEVNQHWSKVYWSDFIPYAHGVRLFGQYYNDRINPEDPYEFIDLLTQTDMQSLERNAQLQDLARMLRADKGLADRLSESLDENPFERKLKQFLLRYGDLSQGVTGSRAADADLRPLLGLVSEMAAQLVPHPKPARGNSASELTEAFLSHFTDDEHAHAKAMLDLARSSYQLRDDDNIHLGRIEAGYLYALQAGRKRLNQLESADERRVLQSLLEQLDPEIKPKSGTAEAARGRYQFRQRQLVGQPAGPGLVKAPARVITDPKQLMDFKSGDVLVCDAVDPNMTFVVPLAAAIVERRGGMLIHGAIIAREYGLPCITGVPQATALIKTGDTITVDGYLGIVTLN